MVREDTKFYSAQASSTTNACQCLKCGWFVKAHDHYQIYARLIRIQDIFQKFRANGFNAIRFLRFLFLHNTPIKSNRTVVYTFSGAITHHPRESTILKPLEKMSSEC
jgi:hypothetical protein